MFERFTPAARATVTMAESEARAARSGHIGTEHLLLGLMHDPGIAGRVLTGQGLQLSSLRDALSRIVGDGRLDASALASLGIDLDQVRRRAEATFGEGALDRPMGARRPGRRAAGSAHPRFTATAKTTIELALHESLARSSGYIGSEHILLGLTRDVGGMSDRLLETSGVGYPTIRAEVDRQLRHSA